MIELLLFLFISGAQKKQAPVGPNYYGTCIQGSHMDNEKCVWDKETVKPAGDEKPRKVTAILLGSPSGDSPYYYFIEPDGKDEPGEVIVGSPDGTKAVLLNSDEYAHLQSLRQAVVDEEKRLAVKYGAKDGQGVACWTNNPVQAPCPQGPNSVYYPPSDHFEYHGQFLLIEKGK